VSDSPSDDLSAAPGQLRLRRALLCFLAYGLALSLIAFWPQHIDEGARRMLQALVRLVPVATPHRVEFGANIILFVPLGALLAIMAPRRRHLVMPGGFLVSLTIESVQGVLLDGRTASLYDVVANTTGTCIGLLLTEFIESVLRRSQKAC
jgi:hypothetical protein